MARIVCTMVVIVLLMVLVGCQGIDSGRSRIVPAQMRSGLTVGVAAGEADIVEQMVNHRQAYRQGLELLAEYYTKTGNNMKLMWVKKEMAALDTMPQYKYIIEAEVAPGDLVARASIPEADRLYWDAWQLEKDAGKFVIVKNENLLRLALDKYNQLIKKHPTSDKIDDAAFKAGAIHDYFKDYTIALLYFQRAYQWDPDTIHPARFRAAFILDKRLHRREEALQLYQEALKKPTEYHKWKEFAEKRVIELTESD